MLESIIYLEGGNGIDQEHALSDMVELGYMVGGLINLYEEPEKLRQLKELNPDYLFVCSTNTYHKRADKLSDYFRTLDYIPKNVIFYNDMSYSSYNKLAKELKEKGTKFFYFGFCGDPIRPFKDN